MDAFFADFCADFCADLRVDLRVEDWVDGSDDFFAVFRGEGASAAVFFITTFFTVAFIGVFFAVGTTDGNPSSMLRRAGV